MAKHTFFITGTDTDVGKTIVTACLGLLFKDQGYSVGVIKPMQCGGEDASFLIKTLELTDDPKLINPYYAKAPMSPHIAFAKEKISINPKKILDCVRELQRRHDIVLIEGAGGIMVPIKKNYKMLDLAKEINAPSIIVSRLGLGTINHTLLTIDAMRQAGLDISGVLFSEAQKSRRTQIEQTNPQAIAQYGNIPVLGNIPFLSKINTQSMRQAARENIKIKELISVKKKQTKQLQQLDKEHVWHPFTQMQEWMKEENLIIDRAEGNYLMDTDGRKYFDGVSSLWVNVHGHRKREIDQALKDQINQLSHSTLLGLGNTPSIKLAKELVKITPKGLEKVFYSDSGSTSVEIAIKMAYQYWQNIGEHKKTKLIHLANSYHGDTLGSVSVGGIDLFHKVYRNLIFKTIQLDFPDCYRAPKEKKYPDFAFEVVDRLEDTLKKRADQCAALIVEPLVQGAAGMIVWPKGILKRMEQLCRKYNIFLIADEVATGFGRTGTMFACEQEKVHPDFLCLAKGITGGYLPLAATLTTNKVYEGFKFPYKEMKTFFHGHTYTGNPLACAAALANLEIFKKEKTLQKIQPKIKHLTKCLKKLNNLSLVGDIRQRGLMVGIELVKNKHTKQPFPWQDKVGLNICCSLRKEGILLRPLGNVIVLMPPLSVTNAELTRIIDALYKLLSDVVRNSYQSQ